MKIIMMWSVVLVVFVLGIVNVMANVGCTEGKEMRFVEVVNWK